MAWAYGRQRSGRAGFAFWFTLPGPAISRDRVAVPWCGLVSEKDGVAFQLRALPAPLLPQPRRSVGLESRVGLQKAAPRAAGAHQAARSWKMGRFSSSFLISLVSRDPVLLWSDWAWGPLTRPSGPRAPGHSSVPAEQRGVRGLRPMELCCPWAAPGSPRLRTGGVSPQRHSLVFYSSSCLLLVSACVLLLLSVHSAVSSPCRSRRAVTALTAVTRRCSSLPRCHQGNNGQAAVRATGWF